MCEKPVAASASGDDENNEINVLHVDAQVALFFLPGLEMGAECRDEIAFLHSIAPFFQGAPQPGQNFKRAGSTAPAPTAAAASTGDSPRSYSSGGCSIFRLGFWATNGGGTCGTTKLCSHFGQRTSFLARASLSSKSAEQIGQFSFTGEAPDGGRHIYDGRRIEIFNLKIQAES